MEGVSQSAGRFGITGEIRNVSPSLFSKFLKVCKNFNQTPLHKDSNIV